MTEFLRALESIETSTSMILAAAIAVLACGLLLMTRRAAAFHAADRSVPPLVNGLASSAALLSAAPFLSLTGLMYAMGSDGLAWLIGLGAGLVLMGVLIAPAFRASGALSISDFLAARYGGRLVPLLATLVVSIVCFLLLVTQLSAIGAVAEIAFAYHRSVAIAAAALLVAIALCAGGMRSATWLAAGLAIAVLAACLAPIGALALKSHGLPFGVLTYGQTLNDLRELEIELLSAGLADAATLKPHLSQFLQLDHANTLALIVTVMAGTAVLPHVLMRQAVSAGGQPTRMAMAWTLLASAIVLAAVPAYAAISKLEIYRVVGKGLALTEVPAIFAQEDVAVHGVPFSLYSLVWQAQNSSIKVPWSWTDPHVTFGLDTPIDANDPAAMGSALKRASPKGYEVWSRLAPDVQKALLDAAKGGGQHDDAARFDIWRKTILPGAATAAGDETGKLTQGAIAVDGNRVAILGMRLAGLGQGWVALFALGAVLAAFGTALATAWTIARGLAADIPTAVRGLQAGTIFAGSTAPDGRGTLAVRLAVLPVVLAGTIAAIRCEPLSYGNVVAWSMSLLAAGLLPALVMGIWWRRGTAAGALAGMASGLLATLVYIGGINFAPHALPPLSLPSWGISDGVHDEPQTASDAEPAFGDEPAVADGPGTAANAVGPAAEEAAPWFGIQHTAAAVFGLPLGFVVLILVSHMSRRPSAAVEHFVWAIRRPGA